MAKKRQATPKKTGRGKTVNAKEAQREAAQAAAAKAENETMALPSANDVQNLARRCRSLKKQGSEITGQIGEMIAQAVEKKSLDRKAFAIARQLDGMSDDKLRVTYRHLLKYMDDLEIGKRATAQVDMFDEDEDEDGGKTDDAPEGGSNVVNARGDFRRRQREIQGENYGRATPAETSAREVSEAAGS